MYLLINALDVLCFSNNIKALILLTYDNRLSSVLRKLEVYFFNGLNDILCAAVIVKNNASKL